jgi:hypothetical protein
MPMPRALKTFITNLGFFELAVAALTMKAALKAWGLERNAFQHGFAKQTDDPKIIAAAEANPGAVLKRPIGSKDEFKEDARLPKVSSAKAAAPLPKIAKPAKRPVTREPKAKSDTSKPDASVIRLDAVRRARDELKAKQRAREEAQQAKERAREEARAEAEAERARAQRQRAIEKAADALSAARARHADAVAEIDKQRAALDAQEEKENRRWDGERRKLESALADAKEI